MRPHETGERLPILSNADSGDPGGMCGSLAEGSAGIGESWTNRGWLHALAVERPMLVPIRAKVKVVG